MNTALTNMNTAPMDTNTATVGMKRPRDSNVDDIVIPPTKTKHSHGIPITLEKNVSFLNNTIPKQGWGRVHPEKSLLLVESLTTPKTPSSFEEGTYTEHLDPCILETLLKSDVLKRKGSLDEGEVSELRKLYNLTDEAIQLSGTNLG